jgi:hypothetical protein
MSDTAVPKGLLRLDELIDEFYGVNSEYKQLKKRNDEISKEIKLIMGDENITARTHDGITASLTTSKKVELLEQIAMNVLKDNDLADGIIKTVEYVDTEALNRAVYDGTISEDLIKDCFETKETIRLGVKNERR